MLRLQCKICNLRFKSLIIDKQKAFTQATEQLTNHVNADHRPELAKSGMLIQQGMQLIPGIVFANDYIVVDEGSPHGPAVAEELGKQSTMLAMLCGWEFEDEDDEEETETGEKDTQETEDNMEEHYEMGEENEETKESTIFSDATGTR